MDYQNFTVEISDNLAHVNFNRPEKANALDKKSWEELPLIFNELDETPAVRAIVIGGEGKHFCAGIDLQMLATLNPAHIKDEGRKREELRRIILWLQASINSIESCRKPVIAAVHGSCIGAGLDLIAACDMRYASQDAKFVLKEVDMGLVADLGSLHRLPRLIPEGVVREMAFTADPLDAAMAHHFGLVNRVFENKETLFARTKEIAAKIAQKSPLTIRGTKEVLNHAREHSVADGLNYVAVWNAATLLGNDIMKAMQAKMTKQQPEFED